MIAVVLSLAVAGPIPDTATQLLLVVAPDLDASTASVTRWERRQGTWQPVGSAVSARVGRSGLAWGRGLHPPQTGLQKVEGDWRAPMGVFALGTAYGADSDAPEGATWPYDVVTERDLWVEDAEDPLYNQHIEVPLHQDLGAYELRHAMRRDDDAHALKLFVAHNAAPDVVPGAGSAIFVHIWRRDGARPTAGCTAMARDDLETVIRWLDPEAHPVFVLLSEAERDRLQADWDLPVAATSPR